MSAQNKHKPPLGRLEVVPIRDYWNHEEQEFTPWLAEQENLQLLADTIGLDLELVGTEQSVGPFRADLLCRDTPTGNLVLVENQLEKTDHEHLGKLLTYAAGLRAGTVVWVASQFTDEHRAALDWLNENTRDGVRTFGLTVELWRIGKSELAPRFVVECQPNDWRNAVDRVAAGEHWQLRYWTRLRALSEAECPAMKCSPPRAVSWLNFPTGKTGAVVAAGINSQKSWLRVELYLDTVTAAARYRKLKRRRTPIEAQIGPLEWEELPAWTASRIVRYKRETDPTNEADWPAQHAWLLQQTRQFVGVFRPLIPQIDAEPDPGDDQAAPAGGA